MNNCKKGTVYMHEAPNRKVYIGITTQSVNKRGGYKGSCYKKSGHHKHFVAAINKYGGDSFKHVILLENRIESEAKYAEKYLIKGYKLHNLCYNITDGGDGTLGFSKKPGNKGIACSEQTKKKISMSNKGRVGYGNKKHISIETRQKISKTRLSKNIKTDPIGSKKKIIIFNEEFTFEFNSIKETSSFLGVSSSYICNCLKNNRKCKNYTLRYA